MATLPAQVITRAGIGETNQLAAAGGDAAPCSINNYLMIDNGTAGPITVTLVVPAGASGFSNVAYGNTVVVASTGNKFYVGPLNPALYADPVTGLCTITYSTTGAGFTVGVYTIQEP